MSCSTILYMRHYRIQGHRHRQDGPGMRSAEPDFSDSDQTKQMEFHQELSPNEAAHLADLSSRDLGTG